MLQPFVSAEMLQEAGMTGEDVDALLALPSDVIPPVAQTPALVAPSKGQPANVTSITTDQPTDAVETTEKNKVVYTLDAGSDSSAEKAPMLSGKNLLSSCSRRTALHAYK